MLGCGQQVFASVINFIAFYIIGLPIGISLALLTDLGSRGMWSGLTIAAYFQLFCLLVFIARLNWKKESDKVRRVIDKQACGNNDAFMLTDCT